jgi:hypothetical protein
LQPLGAILLQLLEDRHDALVDELAEEGWSANQRQAKRAALAAIDAAIERRTSTSSSA